MEFDNGRMNILADAIMVDPWDEISRNGLEALRVIRRQQGKGVFVTDPKTWMREP